MPFRFRQFGAARPVGRVRRGRRVQALMLAALTFAASAASAALVPAQAHAASAATAVSNTDVTLTMSEDRKSVV